MTEAQFITMHHLILIAFVIVMSFIAGILIYQSLTYEPKDGQMMR